MVSDIIIGNNTIIYPDIFNKLSYDNIRRWRMKTYMNISYDKYIKLNDLKRIKIYNDYNVKTSILREKIILSVISVNELTFVSFDSSYICNKNINLMKVINNLKGNIIIVDTYIQYIECKYKIMNPKKTSNFVNLRNVNKYMNLIDKNIGHSNSNIKHIHQLSFDEANKYLFFYEKKYYDTNPKKICKGMRNEFNDDAIVFMLGKLKNTYRYSNVILYTLDKTMIDKCCNVNISTVTVF